MKKLTKQDLENIGFCSMLGDSEPDPKDQCDLRCVKEGAANTDCGHKSKSISLPLDTVWGIVNKLQTSKSKGMQE